MVKEKLNSVKNKSQSEPYFSERFEKTLERNHNRIG